MKKILLGAAGAIAVAAVTFSGSANAACYWNGYNWNCASPQAYYPVLFIMSADAGWRM